MMANKLSPGFQDILKQILTTNVNQRIQLDQIAGYLYMLTPSW